MVTKPGGLELTNVSQRFLTFYSWTECLPLGFWGFFEVFTAFGSRGVCLVFVPGGFGWSLGAFSACLEVHWQSSNARFLPLPSVDFLVGVGVCAAGEGAGRHREHTWVMFGGVSLPGSLGKGMGTELGGTCGIRCQAPGRGRELGKNSVMQTFGLRPFSLLVWARGGRKNGNSCGIRGHPPPEGGPWGADS